MPKVCLSKNQNRHEILRYNMELLKGRRNEDEMAMIMNGAKKNAWRNRNEHPGKLRSDEIYNLCDYFKVDVGTFMTRKLKFD